MNDSVLHSETLLETVRFKTLLLQQIKQLGRQLSDGKFIQSFFSMTFPNYFFSVV